MQRRVLYFLRYFPTLTETFVYREMEGLRARGWDVEVGTLGGRADGALQDALPEVLVHRPPRRALRLPLFAAVAPLLRRPEGRRALAFLSRGRRRREALAALWLAGTVRAFPRVHVHFAGEAAEWALAGRWLYGVPYTVTVHAVDLFRPRPALGEVLRGAGISTPQRSSRASRP